MDSLLSPRSFRSPLYEAASKKTAKSMATRQRILDAAIQCFVEIGFHATGIPEIAEKAKVSRGAIQYYFPRSDDVLSEAVSRLYQAAIESRAVAMQNLPETDKIDHLIDSYWNFLQSPLYLAWRELFTAARTNRYLRAIIEPATQAYEQALNLIENQIFAAYKATTKSAAGAQLSREFIKIFLEGLAMTPMVSNKETRRQQLLSMIKLQARDLVSLTSTNEALAS